MNFYIQLLSLNRIFWSYTHITDGFPGGSVGKESACNVGDLGSIPGLGRSPGGGNGNPLQYSCLEKPHWQRNLVGYSPWGPKESDTAEWLSTTQHSYLGFPDGSGSKESACNARDPDSIPEWGRSHGEGNGYLLQCSWENFIVRGASWAWWSNYNYLRR